MIQPQDSEITEWFKAIEGNGPIKAIPENIDNPMGRIDKNRESVIEIPEQLIIFHNQFRHLTATECTQEFDFIDESSIVERNWTSKRTVDIAQLNTIIQSANTPFKTATNLSSDLLEALWILVTLMQHEPFSYVCTDEHIKTIVEEWSTWLVKMKLYPNTYSLLDWICTQQSLAFTPHWITACHIKTGDALLTTLKTHCPLLCPHTRTIFFQTDIYGDELCGIQLNADHTEHFIRLSINTLLNEGDNLIHWHYVLFE